VYDKKFRIIKQEELAQGHYLLCLDAPEIAVAASPGQFLHVRCTESSDPLLRRPLSIYRADREGGRLCVFYRVVGRGTAALAKKGEGDLVDVMGPLGKGFSLPIEVEKAAVIGGGIGAVPLLFLVEEIKNNISASLESVSVFLGASTAGVMPWAGQFRNTGFRFYLATDDGSTGQKGTVLDLFKETAAGEKYDRIYACGPLPMLKNLQSVVGRDTVVEVSLEELMGCGVGACLSCTCRVRTEDGEVGNARVCTEGPVFDLRDLI